MITRLKTIGYSLLLLVTLAACGGGGGDAPPAYTRATVKLGISGNLPPGTNISGVAVTVTLPSGVTVATDSSGAVDPAAVTPSGIFTSGTKIPPIYSAASGGTPATLHLGFGSATTAGESQPGEFATLVFNLAGGTAPNVYSFSLSNLVVVDASNYGNITGLSGAVTTVTLQ